MNPDVIHMHKLQHAHEKWRKGGLLVWTHVVTHRTLGKKKTVKERNWLVWTWTFVISCM